MPMWAWLVLLFGPAAGIGASSFCDSDGFSAIWSDEFNGTSLDNSSWTVQITTGGSETRDAHGTADSVWIQDGALLMRSNGTWNGTGWHNLTTGAVQSNGKRSFKAGGKPVRVCVSAKLPGGGGSIFDHKGRGVWPAHWLMPDAPACWPCAGEIDMMEMVNGDSMCRGTYHWNNDNRSSDDQQSQGIKIMHQDWAETWHEFAAEYDGVSTVRFALDGKVYHTISSGTVSIPGLQKARFFDVPYYVILNTAIGGGDSLTWIKPPDKDTILPVYHYVDYVRVAQKV